MDAMPTPFSLPVQHLNGCAVVGLPTEIDLTTAPAVTDGLLSALDRGAPGVIVDMSGTRFCDASGIGAIMRAYERARALGSWLRLIVSHPQTRKVLQITHVDQAVQMFATLDDALPRARTCSAGCPCWWPPKPLLP